MGAGGFGKKGGGGKHERGNHERGGDMEVGGGAEGKPSSGATVPPPCAASHTAAEALAAAVMSLADHTCVSREACQEGKRHLRLGPGCGSSPVPTNGAGVGGLLYTGLRTTPH